VHYQQITLVYKYKNTPTYSSIIYSYFVEQQRTLNVICCVSTQLCQILNTGIVMEYFHNILPLKIKKKYRRVCGTLVFIEVGHK